jgi:hypothetical protein
MRANSSSNVLSTTIQSIFTGVRILDREDHNFYWESLFTPFHKGSPFAPLLATPLVSTRAFTVYIYRAVGGATPVV